MRRAEIGIHHHIAGASLLRYAQLSFRSHFRLSDTRMSSVRSAQTLLPLFRRKQRRRWRECTRPNNGLRARRARLCDSDVQPLLDGSADLPRENFLVRVEGSLVS